jgi:hypothetical protein
MHADESGRPGDENGLLQDMSFQSHAIMLPPDRAAVPLFALG